MHSLILVFIVGALHSCSAQSSSTTPSSPTGIGASASGCLIYATSCTNNSSCCDYPSIQCLPDIRNGTSCLSILDLVNLSPSLTGVNILGPLASDIGNSTGAGAIQEIVQVNGNTVYNLTEVVTPNTTTGLGSTLSQG